MITDDADCEQVLRDKAVRQLKSSVTSAVTSSFMR